MSNKNFFLSSLPIMIYTKKGKTNMNMKYEKKSNILNLG